MHYLLRRCAAIAVLALLAGLTSRPAVAAPKPLSRFGTHPGERVADVAYVDVHGARGRLDHLAGPKGMVIFMRDAECPVSQRYTPRMRELARSAEYRGFRFVIVDVTPYSRAEALQAANALPRSITTLYDDRKQIALALDARTSAEAFLVDAHGTLRYRGAIDDQYGITHQKARVDHPWLVNALRHVSRGEDVQEPASDAPGCMLSLPKPGPALRRPVTYHGRVSRIIQEKCQVCHRVGGLGPMPLETYRQVAQRRAVIEAMVGTGRMPPWSARRDVGEWANDRSLSQAQKKDLLAWIHAGAPEGDPREASAPRRFAAGWNIGKPDAVIAIPTAFHVPAEGAVAYQQMYVQTHFGEDKWVTAIEIRPTQPKVVHHALAFLEEPGRRVLTSDERRKLKPGDPVPAAPNDGAMGFFAATVPGSLGIVFPEGSGKKLPKDAWIRLEIHYQPNGSAVDDQTQVGFRFAAGPLREVESLAAPNEKFAIPPYDSHYEVDATHEFRRSGQILSLFPHMHLRGSAFRYELEYPDGKKKLLLDVPHFDFNWQSYYELREPLDVPKGSKLHVTAWYDNSRDNPWNPDPSKTVRWGLLTTDEMMIGYFDFIADGPAASARVRTARTPPPSR